MITHVRLEFESLELDILNIEHAKTYNQKYKWRQCMFEVWVLPSPVVVVRRRPSVVFVVRHPVWRRGLHPEPCCVQSLRAYWHRRRHACDTCFSWAGGSRATEGPRASSCTRVVRPLRCQRPDAGFVGRFETSAEERSHILCGRLPGAWVCPPTRRRENNNLKAAARKWKFESAELEMSRAWSLKFGAWICLWFMFWKIGYGAYFLDLDPPATHPPNHPTHLDSGVLAPPPPKKS